MIQIDNEELIKKFGLSEELTEHSEVEARIYNDYSNFHWAIHIYPPIVRNDIMYFKIYNNFNPGEFTQINSTKCSRISMLSPEYIHCNDCSKEEWILTRQERNHLCEIITNDVWKRLLLCYEEELIGYDGREIDLSNLPMPDYLKLPIKEDM